MRTTATANASDHAVLVLHKALDQQKRDGANMVRLIEVAQVAAPRPLPPNATVSIRA